MAETLKYPIGIQTFSTIIEEGYIYIDKTQYIKCLKDSGKTVIRIAANYSTKSNNIDSWEIIK